MREINNNDIAIALAREFLKEKRSDRRWKNIRLLFWVILFLCLIIGLIKLTSIKSGGITAGNQYVALVRLNGMIAPGRDFSAEEVVPVLQAAFKDKHADGIIIDINSPGGTPVQAAIIHDAIVSLKGKYHKKVVIVGEDLLTSGAYYIAVAADKIYVNANTITGSIGVIVKGFGFVDLMKKVGIERRVYTIGTNKDRLD
ncbi:MAG: S49 family peptidase, partial [Gammaproteobacteria bacterium]|nr:S49 family peptidase [Gammaproteobacteria bacterium]